jgi:hypothetical protein
MSGTITDKATGTGIQNAKITVDLGEGKTREKTTDANGKYKIKKDNRDQAITVTADGYETYTTTIKKEKKQDYWLRPTPNETTRRLIEDFKNNNLDDAYIYLHPSYQGMISLDVFKTELNNSFLKDFIPNMTDYQIQSEQDLESWRDPAGQRTYYNVKEVTVIITMNVEGEYDLKLNFHYVLEGDYYRWLFDRTTSGAT